MPPVALCLPRSVASASIEFYQAKSGTPGLPACNLSPSPVLVDVLSTCGFAVG
jgi:hypothetical protein